MAIEKSRPLSEVFPLFLKSDEIVAITERLHRFQIGGYLRFEVHEIQDVFLDVQPVGIFGTNPRWTGQWWHYVLFFIGFGFIWMRLI